jgi:hypothetical protein
MKIFKCIVTFQKKLLSCLFFETAKIREVKYESDSINVSGRLSYILESSRFFQIHILIII